MKRYLCPNHMHHLKTENKSVQLSSDKCSICRYENRPMTLKDAAHQFEIVANDMRFAHDNPGYDPHGITFMTSLEKTLIKFLKAVHPEYRKGLIERIYKDVLGDK